MSLVILLAVAGFTLHVMPTFVPAGMVTVQHVWAPIVMTGLAVVLAIVFDFLRSAEARGR